jgi:hypothetical protein
MSEPAPSRKALQKAPRFQRYAPPRRQAVPLPDSAGSSSGSDAAAPKAAPPVKVEEASSKTDDSAIEGSAGLFGSGADLDMDSDATAALPAARIVAPVRAPGAAPAAAPVEKPYVDRTYTCTPFLCLIFSSSLYSPASALLFCLASRTRFTQFAPVFAHCSTIMKARGFRPAFYTGVDLLSAVCMIHQTPFFPNH